MKDSENGDIIEISLTYLNISFMNITYRTCTLKDLKPVSEMIHQLYREDPVGKPITDVKIQHTFDSLTQRPDRGIILLFETNSQAIGYAILINCWSNQLGGNIVNIDELFVKREFRNQGIGTQFIQFLKDKKYGNPVALLLEVTPDNRNAKKLYERLGFSIPENTILYMEL